MKRKSVYTCLVMLLMSLALQAKDKDVAVAEALLKRLLPSYIESFQFQKLKGEKDCFTIESVKDKIVIGHIGRFTAQKNSVRMIEIFGAVAKKEPNAVLCLIGDGELKEDMIKKNR